MFQKIFNHLTTRKNFLMGSVVTFSLIFSHNIFAGSEDVVTVFKSPTCGCCTKWVSHMKENGFKVRSFNVSDVVKIKNEKGVPQKLWSCHTAKVGDYLIEGHVPASDIKKLLAEKRPVAGLGVPGMPTGSPGMPGLQKNKYSVYEFDKNGNIKEVAQH